MAANVENVVVAAAVQNLRGAVAGDAPRLQSGGWRNIPWDRSVRNEEDLSSTVSVSVVIAEASSPLPGPSTLARHLAAVAAPLLRYVSMCADAGAGAPYPFQKGAPVRVRYAEVGCVVTQHVAAR